MVSNEEILFMGDQLPGKPIRILGILRKRGDQKRPLDILIMSNGYGGIVLSPRMDHFVI